MSNAQHPYASLVIRAAHAADRARLERLGDLDCKTVGSGTYVLAEIGGELVAAVPVGGGAPLADPFRPLADVVSLLTLRGKQLRHGVATS